VDLSIIAASSIPWSSTMSDTRLTLKLALDHIHGVYEQTEDLVVRDLLKQALNELEAADALISALNNSSL
jgi:hypothetical protein